MFVLWRPLYSELQLLLFVRRPCTPSNYRAAFPRFVLVQFCRFCCWLRLKIILVLFLVFLKKWLFFSKMHLLWKTMGQDIFANINSSVKVIFKLWSCLNVVVDFLVLGLLFLADKLLVLYYQHNSCGWIFLCVNSPFLVSLWVKIISCVKKRILKPEDFTELSSY